MDEDKVTLEIPVRTQHILSSATLGNLYFA